MNKFSLIFLGKNHVYSNSKLKDIKNIYKTSKFADHS